MHAQAPSQTKVQKSNVNAVKPASLGRPGPVHTSSPVIAQRALGNQAAQRMLQAKIIQAKLTVNSAEDEYEREASRLADSVMGKTECNPGQQSPPMEPGRGNLAGTIQAKGAPDQGSTQSGTKKDDEEEKKVQRSAISSASVASTFQDLSLPAGSGDPLDQSSRQFFEPRFGRDFSQVRVHTGPEAARMSGQINALAFTHGQDIYFGEGRYQPSTAHGRELMAHELTHVVQQRTSTPISSQYSPAPVSQTPVRTQRAGLDFILDYVKDKANDIPGYPLLTVILGRDPITDKPVERNAINMIRGVMSLIPGGNALFENLQKSGAIEKAYNWLKDEVTKLDLSWEAIKGLFRKAWEAVSIWNSLATNWEKIKNIFGPPLTRLKNFAIDVGKKILEFVFEGVMTLAGPLGAQIMGMVRKAGAAFSAIIKDPIGFVSNLINAVKQGFKQFSSNIWEHLKKGLFDWLFGALAGAGLKLPSKFDFMGIISIILQVLGLTYASLRAKLVKLIGEKPVKFLEDAFDFLKTLVTKGITAAWQKILEFATNLVDTVIGGIRDWAAKSIVVAAITKLVNMFNPAGALFEAVKAVYNTIQFFIERAKQIADLANAVFDSIANIASGNIAAAASYVETTMVRTIPVILGFLARLIGLGNVSEEIKKVIQKIQGVIDKAIDKVVNFIVDKGRALIPKTPEKIEKEKEKAEGELSINPIVVKFKAEGKDHKLWTVEKDGSAIVMVSSDEQPLEAFLKGLESQAEGKAELLAKLNKARQKALETKIDYAETIKSIKAADKDKAKRKSGNVKQDEDDLGKLLSDVVSELAAENDAPKGDNGDPVPIIWWKDFSRYPTISFYNAESKETVIMGPMSRKSIPGYPEPLGVSPGNIVREKMKLMRREGKRNTKKDGEVKEALLKLPDLKLNGKSVTKNDFSVDHVKDDGWNGPDIVENLWPLDPRLNILANAVYQQYVAFKTDNNSVKISRVMEARGKYFYIWAIKDGGQLSSIDNTGTTKNLPVNNSKIPIYGITVPRKIK